MTFEAWRLSYQSDDAAARAAFDQVTMLSAQLHFAKQQLAAIAEAPRADFEDRVELIDWAKGQAAGAIASLAIPGITRAAGKCIGCGQPLGEPHAPGCQYAPFLPGEPL